MKKSFARYVLYLSAYTATQMVCAEITTDGSIGTATQLNGPNYTIGQQLGKLAGDNLFHSFQTFNINTGESATFTGHSSIKNVISRVTGGELSNINGSLNSEIGSQGFYFINPAGVFFGPDARVNVPASFHVSTADAIRFSDGSQYSASDLNGSSISVESPSAFGFGSNQSAKITFDNPKIELNKQQTLSIVSGDIEIIKSNNLSTIDDTTKFGLTAQQGEIRLIAHGNQASDIAIKGDPGAQHQGNLNISGGRIFVSGDASGSIVIRAGDAQLIQANLVMDNSGDKDATNGLDVHVGNLLMESQNIVDADALGAGKGADINIHAENQMTINHSKIDLISQGSGNGGDINLTAKDITINHGSLINTSTKAQGNGGNIYLNANNILLNGGISQLGQKSGVLIATQSLSQATGGTEVKITQAQGHGGNISINADSIEVVQTAAISTSTFAKGNGGVITINAANLNIDSEGFLGIESPLSTGVFSNSNVYETSVFINHPELELTDPNRTETVAVSLPASGNAGEINLNISNELRVANGGQVSSSSFSNGDAGKINLQANKVIIDRVLKYVWKTTANGELIPYDQWDSMAGDFVDQVQLTGLFTGSSGNSTGNAGVIHIQAQNLSISNGAAIESSSSTSGKAGSISIEVSELLTLNDVGLISIKGQNAPNNSALDTPTLNINANEIELDGGSNISAQSGGSAAASNINIHASQGMIVKGLSQISSEAENSDSGTISISGASLLLEQGLVTTSVGRLVDGNPIIMGDGGNLNIHSDALIMSNGFIQANTQGVGGRGGAIFINSDQVVSAYNSLEVGAGVARDFVPNSGINIIQAAAPEGTPGEINISSPIDNVTSIIHAVDSSFKPLIVINDNPCQIDSGEVPSSLIFTGRGVTPQAATDNIILAPNNISAIDSDKAAYQLIANQTKKPNKILTKSVCAR